MAALITQTELVGLFSDGFVAIATPRTLVQPFWALPLLAIFGLDARAIMGYCSVIFAVGFVCLGGGILVWGAG